MTYITKNAAIESNPAKKMLGELYRWIPVKINSSDVLANAKKQYTDSTEFIEALYKEGIHLQGKQDRMAWAPDSLPYRWILPHLLQAVAKELPEHLSRDIELTADNVHGQNNQAWVRTKNSISTQLGNADWRLSDWLCCEVSEAPSNHEGGIPLCSFALLKQKGALGNGVVGTVHPSLLGLEENYEGVLQVRADIRTAGTITRLFAGLMLVSARCDNLLAWADGYGTEVKTEIKETSPLGKGSTLFVYIANESHSEAPPCAYNLQGLQYQGKDGWHAAIQFGHIHPSKIIIRDPFIQNCIKADAPVHVLGGQALQHIIRPLLKPVIVAGQSRMVLPAALLGAVQVHRNIANTLGGFYTSSVTHKRISGFYAPFTLRAYFEQGGGIGSEWILNRCPDLPIGVCAQRHVLLGYINYNCFAINERSLQLSGLVCDGDSIKVYPPVERGGLYEAFNDLEATEQHKRLELANGKNDNERSQKVYACGAHRYAGQLACKELAGLAQINARKFIDKGDFQQAYTLSAWIKTAITMQKYDTELPKGTDNLRRVPRCSTEMRGGVFFTDFFRQHKEEPEWYRNLSPQQQQTYEAQLPKLVEHVREMAKMSMKAAFKRKFIGCEAARLFVMRYGFLLSRSIGHSIKAQRKEKLKGLDDQGLISRYNNNSRHFPYKKPEVQQIAPTIQAQKLIQTLEMLERLWSMYIDCPGHVQLQSTVDIIKMKNFLYITRDMLREAAIAQGLEAELAKACTEYRHFAFFADAESLKAFYARSCGLPKEIIEYGRLSKYFTVFNEASLFKATHKGGTIYTNNTDCMIGMFFFKAGELKLTEKDNQYIFSSQNTPYGYIDYTCAATNRADACIELSIYLGSIVPASNWLPDGLEELINSIKKLDKLNKNRIYTVIKAKSTAKNKVAGIGEWYMNNKEHKGKPQPTPAGQVLADASNLYNNYGRLLPFNYYIIPNLVGGLIEQFTAGDIIDLLNK